MSGHRPGRHLVVHAHPQPESFSRALFDTVVNALEEAEAELRTRDLYAEGFEPELRPEERAAHLGPVADKADIAGHVEDLQWAQHLVLVYPTWWSGPPAMLKGWFDRVWVNEVAFVLPPGATAIKGQLGNIRSITIVTTHGSSKIRNLAQGQGGRRMILRGLRTMCGLRCRTKWLALYDMDRATQRDREEFIEQVRGRMVDHVYDAKLHR